MKVSGSVCGSRLSYEFENGHCIFSEISFRFLEKKYAIVGPNGVGKSTLLRLICGDLRPRSGDIQILGRLEKVDQVHHRLEKDESQTVEQALGVSKKFRALEKIENGSSDLSLFEIVDQDWDLRDQVQKHLSELGISHLPLDRPVCLLSGGELVKVALIRALLKKPDILVLDEPTNNLDFEGKRAFESFLSDWKGCLILVSHDRSLLNQVDSILELSNRGLQLYGGNFEFYEEARLGEEQSLQQKIVTAKQEQKRQKQELQKSLERQQRKMAQGRRKALDGSIAKTAAGVLKRKAQSTLARVKDTQESRLLQAQMEVKSLSDQIKQRNLIQVDMPESLVPGRKEIFELKDFNFQFEGSSSYLYSHPLSFLMMGPLRAEILGKNGSGKTTLIRLLLETLETQFLSSAEIPQGKRVGKALLKTQRVAYLDQSLKILGGGEDSLLDRFSEFTPQLDEAQRRIRLGRFLFEQSSSLKKIHTLSGGERMRAALACTYFQPQPPELLILDEPTNNLDLDSIEQIESALSQFQGALLVISHDSVFKKKIGVTQSLKLGFE